MAELNKLYKCEICGNVVSVIQAGAGELVCCGQPMTLLEEKISDEGKEKHVPIIEKTDAGIVVKVGSVPHPMEEEHYIEWIEIYTDKGRSKKFLKPGEKPEVVFPIKAQKMFARAYCNVHGLWNCS